jgi:hypothetical protein
MVAGRAEKATLSTLEGKQKEGIRPLDRKFGRTLPGEERGGEPTRKRV